MLQQGVSEFEIICVDDGSTDDSLAQLKLWANRDSRIRVLAQKNNGQGAARNLGISVAVGRYILFLDSDDILLPGSLNCLRQSAGENEVIAYEHQIFYDAKPEVFHANAFRVTNSADRKQLLRQMGVVWNKMVLRSWWIGQKLSFKERVIFEDIPVHWKLVLLPEKILHLNESLYALRIRPSSTTGANRFNVRRMESIFAFDEVGKFLSSSNLQDKYNHVYAEIMLKNLAHCIDDLSKAGGELERKVIQLACDRKKIYDRQSYTDYGLSWREADVLNALEGKPFAIIRRKVFCLVRSLYLKIK